MNGIRRPVRLRACRQGCPASRDRGPQAHELLFAPGLRHRGFRLPQQGSPGPGAEANIPPGDCCAQPWTMPARAGGVVSRFPRLFPWRFTGTGGLNLVGRPGGRPARSRNSGSSHQRVPVQYPGPGRNQPAAGFGLGRAITAAARTRPATTHQGSPAAPSFGGWRSGVGGPPSAVGPGVPGGNSFAWRRAGGPLRPGRERVPTDPRDIDSRRHRFQRGRAAAFQLPGRFESQLDAQVRR